MTERGLEDLLADLLGAEDEPAVRNFSVCHCCTSWTFPNSVIWPAVLIATHAQDAAGLLGPVPGGAAPAPTPERAQVPTSQTAPIREQALKSGGALPSAPNGAAAAGAPTPPPDLGDASTAAPAARPPLTSGDLDFLVGDLVELSAPGIDTCTDSAALDVRVGVVVQPSAQSCHGDAAAAAAAAVPPMAPAGHDEASSEADSLDLLDLLEDETEGPEAVPLAAASRQLLAAELSAASSSSSMPQLRASSLGRALDADHAAVSTVTPAAKPAHAAPAHPGFAAGGDGAGSEGAAAAGGGDSGSPVLLLPVSRQDGGGGGGAANSSGGTSGPSATSSAGLGTRAPGSPPEQPLDRAQDLERQLSQPGGGEGGAGVTAALHSAAWGPLV